MLPKSAIETVQFMNMDYYLGDLSYDLVSETYSFKKNKDLKDLKLYPAEFYGLFNREVGEVTGEVIQGFVVDRLIPYNRMKLKGYLNYYNIDFWDEWDLFLKSKGMCFLDTYWIRTNKNETYKNNILNIQIQ